MLNITPVTASSDSSDSSDRHKANFFNNHYEISKLSSLHDLDFLYREGKLNLKGV